AGILLDFLLRWTISHTQILSRLRKITKHLIHFIPLIIIYISLPLLLSPQSKILILSMRVCSVLMILTIVLSLNSTIKHLTNLYWEKNSIHKPIKGGIQVIQFVIFTVGAIISIAILLDKSPGKLLAGLGASTAVLMLIFKDSILGFVAGIQLSINDMVRIGDWVEIPDGSANGIVEDITLNTVKIRNWDNTISTIPPYNLISNPFKNWRGMEESGGRQVDKKIKIDSHTIKYCDEEFINKIKNSIPLMSHTEYDKEIQITNTKLFRDYIEKYLEHHPMVNNQLDIIITTSQQNEYGLTTRIYFFIKEKSWKKYEMIQSEIIDNILASATIFELNIFQRD
ncbi:MAG: mechanosensitive ion channel, partial [Bacteroidales bacterium]|nr:mechanosensitive ion channel [Bacteroidales bacterium]